MTSVLHATLIYAFLLGVFRLAGRRTLGQITTFDFILLMVISEAVQNALVRNDYSLTNAFLTVLTLVVLDIGLSLIQGRSRRLGRVLQGLPLLLVHRGECLEPLMRKARVQRTDILAAARKTHGLSSMAQIDSVVLETDGTLSIIPASGP